MADGSPAHRAAPAAAEAAPPAPTSRVRWLVPAVLLLVWLAVASVGGPFQGRLAEVQENDAAAFLPDGVESTLVTELAEGFRDDATFPAFLVVESTDGEPLGPEELQAVGDLAAGVPDEPVVVGTTDDDLADAVVGDFLALPDAGAAPAGPPGAGPLPLVPAADGEAVLVLLPFDADAVEEQLADGESALPVVVEALREADDEALPDGLTSYVAGPAGTLADFTAAFGEIDGILLGVALTAVLVILLLVYRSPALPFLVILSSVFALAAASVVVYVLAREGVVDLNGQSQGILFILVVGAATDYALLLVARYREELRRTDDRYAAMRTAWRRAVEPVVASGATVILGLLCLLLSDLGSNRGLGPVASVGIVTAMLSALTFLPAALLVPAPVIGLLAVAAGAGVPAAVTALSGGSATAVLAAAVVGAVVAVAVAVLVGLRLRRRRRARAAAGEPTGAGRWVFWPAEPHLGEVGPEGRGVWARVAGLVGRRPRRVWVSTVVGLGALAACLPLLDATGVAQSDVFLVEVESVAGQDVLAEHFPAGADSPTLVLADEVLADDVLDVVRADPGVTSADLTRAPGSDPTQPGEPVVSDGRVQVEAVLADPADSLAAQDTVERLREDLDAVSEEALVGGSTAQQLDVLQVSTADLYRIIPVVLGVIFVVLALLLRSIVAPALILAANILSFAATLGAAALVFTYVLGYPGADPAVPLFGFVFLVALGIDYSIFLMTRVREESARVGTRPGILSGLAVTGGVITSAGVVLAATFAALGVLPILFLAQIAFIVAFGVLLDTLVVRSLLVPALSYDIGRRVWWPHRLSRADAPGEQVAAGHGRHVEEPEPVAAG
ncbi:MMPL family transporter [Aquipuribacter nitratireducens]|uniref:MMPL family transporter n=1 Tax=Aquipuribacter nitratireducens TaxID=650104 RepID=A0ABW0GLK0_9MICO